MVLLIWLIIAIVFGVIGANVARNKGKDAAAWGIICFLLPFAVIFLLASSSQSLPLESPAEDLDQKWAALVRYDPEIRAAAEQVAPYGPLATSMLRDLYTAVQNKAALPSIISDIINSAKTTGLAPLVPSGFAQIEQISGVPIYGNNRGQFWLNGQTFGDKSTARVYARVLSKKSGN